MFLRTLTGLSRRCRAGSMAHGIATEPLVNAAQEDLPYKSQYRGLR
jgi:hypothetical protein